MDESIEGARLVEMWLTYTTFKETYGCFQGPSPAASITFHMPGKHPRPKACEILSSIIAHIDALNNRKWILSIEVEFLDCIDIKGRAGDRKATKVASSSKLRSCSLRQIQSLLNEIRKRTYQFIQKDLNISCLIVLVISLTTYSEVKSHPGSQEIREPLCFHSRFERECITCLLDKIRHSVPVDDVNIASSH